MKEGRKERTKEGGSSLAPRKWTGRKEGIGIEKGGRERTQAGIQAGRQEAKEGREEEICRNGKGRTGKRGRWRGGEGER